MNLTKLANPNGRMAMLSGAVFSDQHEDEHIDLHVDAERNFEATLTLESAHHQNSMTIIASVEPLASMQVVAIDAAGQRVDLQFSQEFLLMFLKNAKRIVCRPQMFDPS